MAKRIGGNRRKTRYKFTKNIRTKGKVSITKYLQSFREGDKVQLSAEPAIHKGVYFKRFHGKTGTVISKQGNCYKINIKDINMIKTIIVHPVHLKKAK
jgi:large subunit ribosomal protein L21e